MKNKSGSNKGPFIKILFYYYNKEWVLSLTLLVLCLIIVLCSILLPILTYQLTVSITQKLSYKIGEQEDLDNLLYYWNLDIYILIYLSIADILIYCLVSYFYELVSYNLGRKIEIYLRNKSLEKLVNQDISYFSNKKTGEILTKVINDTQIVGDQAIQVPLQLGVSILEIIAASIMMIIFSWAIGLLALTIFIIAILAMFISFFVTRKKVYKVRNTITQINGDVTDRLNSIRLIKSSGTESYETNRFNKIHKKYYNESKKVNSNQALMLTIIWGSIFILNFSTILFSIYFYGFSENPYDGLDFFKYKFASFQLAESMLTWPLLQIMNALFGLINASVASERILNTINSKSLLKLNKKTIKLKEIDGDIKFINVNFAYPDKPNKCILKDFTFTFKKGKSYAIVGETGCGKSTIIKLILRYYDPTNGEIKINKYIDLKSINLSKYLGYIGYVEQEPQILYGDVYENIKYGNFKAAKYAIKKACKKAELHHLIMSWPDQYNTILGERGFMLSGGQKQRLIIARMFLKNPKILLLDEATSALDSIVEKEIQTKLEHLMKDRTTIVVAHRLTTIKNVDEIIVLGKDGKGILQKGNYSKLKKQKGPFKKIYEASLID
ncbi:ABC transporter ATP-binding protein [Spiroplasma turonicum]|uniref:ABC transporter ATP-binding protein/permease n=1 Tax=Spiroplasma turonicum TaxID=216946 RepID=A0A0K1P7C5_9MOLU|nr:ABC transporter ATP-binding protein [Spiroplasma turonicum]AKU79807.1 ABC transporter ATP-binding protein/permease [Spiroplasma turonicum]ALX70825.1 ABC transporter ATP-binding protein [Spiroplasma turonicum]